MLGVRLRCQECGSELGLDERRQRCPRCRGRLGVAGEVWPARLETSEPAPLARYRALLPFGAAAAAPHLGEGATPLLSSRLSGHVRGQLDLKLETANPHGGSLDRGVAAVMARARQLAVRHVACLEPALFACVVAYAARAGLSWSLLIPHDVDLVPAAALEDTIHLVRVAANAARLREALLDGAVSAAYLVDPADPFWSEGVSTTAFEVLEATMREPVSAIVLPPDRADLLSAFRGGLDRWLAAGLGGEPTRLAIATLDALPAARDRIECAGVESVPVTAREGDAARGLLAAEDGLRVGPSGAAAFAAAVKLVRAAPPRPRRIVALVDEWPKPELAPVPPGLASCALADLDRVLRAYRVSNGRSRL